MQRLPVNKYNCSKACTDRGRWKSRCRGCVEIALCRGTLFLFFWQGKTIMGYRSCGTRPNQMSSQEKTRTAILKVNWSNYASMVIKDLSLPETRATILDPSRLRLGHDFKIKDLSLPEHALLFWTLRGFVSVMTFYSATRLPFPISNSGQRYWAILPLMAMEVSSGKLSPKQNGRRCV